MTKEEYQEALLVELEKNKLEISEKFDLLLGKITDKITGIYIGIFTSQDGDGMFSIHANAEGPDLYVRQKEIEEFAWLFDPRISPGKIEPFVPTFYDPFSTGFCVNDCIVDLVSTWFVENFSNKTFPEGVSFTIVSSEGYGTLTPIKLNK